MIDCLQATIARYIDGFFGLITLEQAVMWASISQSPLKWGEGPDMVGFRMCLRSTGAGHNEKAPGSVEHRGLIFGCEGLQPPFPTVP